MTDIVIGTKTTPFSWLPNYMVNGNVSAESLAAALYLNGKPEGWIARPSDIRKRFSWGRHTWLKVSKELRDLKMLHETKDQSGTALTFLLATEMIQSAPSENQTVRKPTVGKSNPIERKTPTKKDVLKNHDHDVEKKEPEQSTPKTSSPPMKVRIASLDFNERCIYDKLVSFKGVFPGTAIAIVEANSQGRINNIIEMAFRDGITNPVGYIIEALYNQQGREAGETKEAKT